MPDQNDSVLRTFRLQRATINDLSLFLRLHPEVGSLNHLVSVALKEFVSLHANDKTWLKIESQQP